MSKEENKQSIQPDVFGYTVTWPNGQVGRAFWDGVSLRLECGSAATAAAIIQHMFSSQLMRPVAVPSVAPVAPTPPPPKKEPTPAQKMHQPDASTQPGDVVNKEGLGEAGGALMSTLMNNPGMLAQVAGVMNGGGNPMDLASKIMGNMPMQDKKPTPAAPVKEEAKPATPVSKAGPADPKSIETTPAETKYYPNREYPASRSVDTLGLHKSVSNGLKSGGKHTLKECIRMGYKDLLGLTGVGDARAQTAALHLDGIRKILSKKPVVGEEEYETEEEAEDKPEEAKEEAAPEPAFKVGDTYEGLKIAAVKDFGDVGCRIVLGNGTQVRFDKEGGEMARDEHDPLADAVSGTVAPAEPIPAVEGLSKEAVDAVKNTDDPMTLMAKLTAMGFTFETTGDKPGPFQVALDSIRPDQVGYAVSGNQSLFKQLSLLSEMMP